MEAFFRGSHTTNFVTWGFSRSYNQAAEVPSSKVTCESPRSPAIKSRTMLAFVSMTHSITIFPAPFLTAIEMLSWCTSMPIYFRLSIEGAPFCSGFEPNTQNPTPKGAPFYIASDNRIGRHYCLHANCSKFESNRGINHGDSTRVDLSSDLGFGLGCGDA